MPKREKTQEMLFDTAVDERPRMLEFEDDGARNSLLASYVRSHPVGAALLALIGIALVAMLVMFGLNASSLPDTAQVETDARERIQTPAYTAGEWGLDDRLALTSLEVVSRSRSSNAPDGSDISVTFGATAYANADVIAHFTCDSMTVDKSVSLGYARQQDKWVPAGSEHNATVAFTARKGVDTAKVLKAAMDLLTRAEAERDALKPDAATSSQSTDTPSLASLYSNGQVAIKSEVFDEQAQTDELVLRYVYREGYASYECEVTALFAFHAVNGAWELSGLELSEGASSRTYKPIIGTWKGTFQAQSTQGTKCLGANSAPFEVTIRSYASDTTGTRVIAQISGVAHYHEHPEKDEDKDGGDKVFESIEIPLVLQTSPSQLINGDIVFQGALPETAGGIVTVAIAFGTPADPEAVAAVVKTEHSYDSSFIGIPFERQAVWNDSYILTRKS